MNKIEFKLTSTQENEVSHTKVEHKGEIVDILVDVVGWVCRTCYMAGMSEREFASKMKSTFKIVKKQMENGVMEDE